ncbi:MAG TPA: phosphotransferase [Acidimicrobiales bacterium]|nr:phosphotransferase [Acidimicrobiales bacterium]
MSVDAVLRRFGISDAGWRRLGRGNVNDLWRVHAAAGDYVLRRTPVETLLEHTEREHLVLRHLADAGWSVSMPVAVEDGSTSVRIDDRTWWLAPWLPGRRPPMNTRTAARIGTLLANLHGALAPLAPLPAIQRDWRHYPRTIIERTIPRHGWRFAEALVDLERADPTRGGRLRRELDRVTEALADVPVGATVVGHGDLHTGNLLVHRGTTSVLDFEFSGLQERVNDVAIAVCHVDGDPRLGGAIVDGYGALTDEERRTVPLFFDAHLLSHSTWVTFAWSMGGAGRSQSDVLAELDKTLDQLGTCRA